MDNENMSKKTKARLFQVEQSAMPMLALIIIRSLYLIKIYPLCPMLQMKPSWDKDKLWGKIEDFSFPRGLNIVTPTSAFRKAAN